MSGGVRRGMEEVIRRCQLGVRFSDAATAEPLTGGLHAELRDEGGRVRASVRGPTGIYSFHSIPGLRAHEDIDLRLPVPVGTRPFALSVVDLRARYLPAALRLALPRAEPRLEVPLFPAPSYRGPPEWAVLRGRVGDAAAAGATPDVTRAPAAWARIDVEVPGKTSGTGVSDARGEFAVFFPYPPRNGTQQWTLRVTARYRPAARSAVAGSAWPDLASILAQPAARVVTSWPDAGPQATAVRIDTTLKSGEAARVITTGRSALWLVPATS